MGLPARQASQGGLLARNVGRLATAFRRPVAQRGFVPPGTDAGWGGTGLGYGALSRRINDYIDTYGGNTSVTWIYACATLIMDEMSLYDYAFADLRRKEVPIERVPEDLRDLIEQPNRFMTYEDFVAYKEMDTLIVGNSWWLKDRPNPLRQPAEVMRLLPQYVRPLIDSRGILVGWIYTPPGIGVAIKYGLDEVIHYKNGPSPHSEWLGMGVVQGIAEDAGAKIALGDHVVGFFTNGARISGVLTVSGALTETQFERLKRQFKEEYAGTHNDFSVLIAEQGLDYKPLTVAPGDAAIVEIEGLEKDAILAGFGVHEEMLGGTGNAGDVKMSDAQKILTRRMRPRARRFSTRTTLDLTGFWSLRFAVDPESVRSQAEKHAMAKDAIQSGLSLNEARVLAGKPEFTRQNYPWITEEEERLAKLPLLPSGYGPYTRAGPGFVGPGPTGAPTPPRTNPEQPGLPVEDDPDRQRPDRADEGDDDRPRELNLGPKALGPGPNGKGTITLPSGRVIATPDGFEELGELDPKQADSDTVEQLVELQADVYREEVPLWETDQVGFFNEQRRRVVGELGKFADVHTAKRRDRIPKKELDPDRIWQTVRENEELDRLYRARGRGIAQRTVNAIAEILDASSADIRLVVDELAKHVAGVNETTRLKIVREIALGIQRNYSVQQIANGVPEENYRGIAGVFDEAVETRALTIARTEVSTVYNLASLSEFEQIGAGRVEVFDGNYDEACEEANGDVWTIAFARAHPIEHPRCVRFFGPVFTGTGRS